MNQSLKTEILSIRSIEEWREASELLGRMLTHLKGIAVAEFKVGDNVELRDKKGIKMTGRIIKINSTTIKVDAKPFGVWRCSPTMIKKIP